MARRPRNQQISHSLIFHIVNRGVLKQEIFHDIQDFLLFKMIIQNYKDRFDFSLYHWCLMHNHYHLVLELKEPSQLSKVIGGIQQSFAMKYHKKYQTAGRLFQNRFKSQAIDKESYCLACGRYVEQNPVRADLCPNAWDWPWSSAAFYSRGKKDKLTTVNPLWEQTDFNSYQNWLSQKNIEDEQIFKSSTDIIGSNSFRETIIKAKGRIKRRQKGRKPDFTY